MKINHAFVSGKADGADSTLVKPSDWNADHEIISAADGVVVGRPAGQGAGPMVEMPVVNVFLPGFLWPYAGSTIPTGWLLCDGSLLNRADQPNLFAAIGTAFNTGGEAGTQFRIPDLRGRAIVMVDGGAGRWPGLALGTGAGSLYRQPRSYGNVTAQGSTDFRYGAMSGYINGGSASAGSGSGAGTNFATNGTAVAVNGGTLGVGVNGNIVNDGGNVTDQFDVAQPSLGLNILIKT